MARIASNKLLHLAKASKSDEFYTLYEDIERELVFYSRHFQNKTVYCNCDNPVSSNFVRYFYYNFKALGLKRLIASNYCRRSSNLFEVEDNQGGGAYCIIDNNTNDKQDSSTSANVGNISIRTFNGDGDFRSPECVALLKQADIVVTNPPFSLFREFVAQMCRFNKQFLIIGNINAITYKEIFSLIKDNKVWLGVHLGRGISGFLVPDDYELYGTEARINEQGQRIVSPNNCLWLTNLDIDNRHSFIELNKTYCGNEDSYPKYDNYDGINVNRTQDIPYDYDGAMGVPITFLHKYNPAQFEILRFRKGADDRDLAIQGKCPYFRILIRNKHPRPAARVTKSMFA